MSNAPKPEDYDGNVSQGQIDELEKLRQTFLTAYQNGSSDLDEAREAYQSFANHLLIDLSGKLDPTDTVPPTTEPPKPTEGTVKEGGWGGNTDPDTWKTAAMKNPPEQFKVVDNAGVNVATNFTTQPNAQGYIDYAVWHKHNDPVTPPTNGGQPTGDKDKNGILCIKKSTSANKVFENFKLEEKMRNYASGKPSEWSTEYTCDLKEKLNNLEATIYEKINGFKKEPDTMSLKLLGPPHKDGARFWIIPDFATDGSPKRTLEIEDPHPKNRSINPKPEFLIGETIIGKWIGYKGITWFKDGVRHVESWIHFPVTNIDAIAEEQDKWRKYMQYDTTEKKYFEANGTLVTSRLDGVKKGDPPTYKYASVREIEV